MLYPKDKISEFKGNLKSSIQDWAEMKIDALCEGKPKMKAASVYMKRGLNNWLEREDGRINKMVDNSLLFVADKDGSLDTDILIEDMVTMFKEMDVQKMDMGMFHLEYGKGEVSVAIPHNFFLDMIFGDLGKVRLTANDFLELKELL